MFSKTCEYAIRAVIFIAGRSELGFKSGIKEIAEAIDSPESFIAKILQDLARKGLILSAKGPNGGFYIDDTCKKKTLADIVMTIDGDKIFRGCGLGLKNCSEKHPCPLHFEFKAIRKKIHDMLKSISICEMDADLSLSRFHLRR